MCKYKISIIIPIYNTEKYLETSISSVINQTIGFDNIELILINDGSIDDSYKICEKYKKLFDNVKYINEKNHGVSYSRNLGIKLSKGKYILFLDSDDFISKNTCKDLYVFFENNYDNIDLVTYPIMRYRHGKYNMHYRYKTFYKNGTSVYDVIENPYLIQANVNVMIKNSSEILFNNKMRFVEDEDFVTRILMNKKKIGYVKSARYYYINRKENANNTIVVNPDVIKSVFDNYEKLLEEFNYNVYVQSLFLNALRWRMDEDSLFPSDIDTQEYIKNKIIKILKNIDNKLIINYPKLNYLEKNYIFNLKNENKTLKINDSKFKLFVNDMLFSEKTSINIKLFRCSVYNNKLNFSIGLNDPLFDVLKPKMYILCDNTKIDLNLNESSNDLTVYDGCKYVSNNILDYKKYKTIKIFMTIDNKDYLCNIDYSKYKNYYNPLISVKENCISFVNKKRKDYCLNFTDKEAVYYKIVSSNIIDIKNNSIKNILKYIKANKVIITSNHIPFENIIKRFKKYINFEVYWLYDGNNSYKYNREESIIDYVIVNSIKEKEEVIDKLNYNDNEVILIK